MSPPTSEAIKAEIAAYLKYCIESESPPRVSELAVEMGISTGRLYRICTSVIGTSPGKLLKRLQLYEAQRIMSSSAKESTARLAYRCAFGTRRTFFRTFNRLTSSSPKLWLRTRHAKK